MSIILIAGFGCGAVAVVVAFVAGIVFFAAAVVVVVLDTPSTAVFVPLPLALLVPPLVLAPSPPSARVSGCCFLM
jgi:hypothetical protein